MRKTILLIVAVLLSANCFSQKELETKTKTLLDANNFNGARSYLDSCVKSKSYEKSGTAWYYRGFAYKKLYTTQENTNRESLSRITALESFKKSMDLDNTKPNIESNKENIKYLTVTLYNDAAYILSEGTTKQDTANFPTAKNDFELYKKYATIVDTSKDYRTIKENEVKFKLGLGYIYNVMFNKDATYNVEYYNLAKQQYMAVLSMDESYISKENLKMLKDWKAGYDENERVKKLLSVSKYYTKENSIDKTITLIKDEKKKETKSSYNVSEDALNNFGYELIKLNKTDDALKIFTLNTELYPNSFNTYDSLGECLLKLNKKDEGLKAYKKSLELNPKNKNASKVLSETK